MQDRSADVLSVEIEDFPNEDGWFMLWELSIADDRRSTRVVPVFVNDRLVLRPIAGKRIMDALLRPGVRLTVGTASNADAETWARLEELSQDFAYNDFKDLSERHERATKENHDKYAYALELRMRPRGALASRTYAPPSSRGSRRSEPRWRRPTPRSGRFCQSSGACCS